MPIHADRTLAASSHLLQILSTLLAIQFSESEIDQNLCLLPGYSQRGFAGQQLCFFDVGTHFTANKKISLMKFQNNSRFR